MKRKQMVKQVISCLITISLTMCMVQYVGRMLDPKWAEDGFDVIHAFHSIDDNSLDVIVYGSSHAWKGCDTRVMCDDYGLAAYNYGCNWQAINTTLLFLQDSLRTQSPKVVCIETGLVDHVEKDVDLDGQIYYTRAMSSFEGKRKYLYQCFGKNIERYVSYYVPLTMFHDNWNCIDYENFLMSGYQRFVDTKGYCVGTEVREYVMPDYNDFAQYELSEDSLEILDEIVSVCNEKNIQIIFYTCPYADEYNYSDAMRTYAIENNCAYLNLFEYMDEMNLNGETDLQDEGHLNESGAGKVASFLGDYIVNNYDVKHAAN